MVSAAVGNVTCSESAPSGVRADGDPMYGYPTRGNRIRSTACALIPRSDPTSVATPHNLFVRPCRDQTAIGLSTPRVEASGRLARRSAPTCTILNVDPGPWGDGRHKRPGARAYLAPEHRIPVLHGSMHRREPHGSTDGLASRYVTGQIIECPTMPPHERARETVNQVVGIHRTMIDLEPTRVG